MKLTLKQAEELVSRYKTAIFRNDSGCKTAMLKIGNRYVRVSIVYSQKAVVFTDPPTQKQIIRFYD